MNGWMIATGVLAVAFIALLCITLHMHRKLRESESGAVELTSLQQALYSARSDCVRCRRELDDVYDDLEEEQARSVSFESAYFNQLALTEQAMQQARTEEARRIETEKSVYAGRMRIGLLEKEVAALQSEQTAQELLYQDILREHEETIARLQEPAKRKPRKKPDMLDQQITLNDLLEENNR